MAKIDIEKFIESILSIAHSPSQTYSIASLIESALKDQELQYKDGKIVEIEVESTIKKGNWYTCIMDIASDDLASTIFKVGETYYCHEDGFLTVGGGTIGMGRLDKCFRLATEEEKVHKFKIGDKIRSKFLNIKGTVVGTAYEYGWITLHYEHNNPPVFPVFVSALEYFEHCDNI